MISKIYEDSLIKHARTYKSLSGLPFVLNLLIFLALYSPQMWLF